MRHRRYKEWAQLAACDELGEEQVKLLEIHCETCAECRTELETLRSFSAKLPGAAPGPVADKQLLEEARRNLRAALRREQSRPSWRRVLREIWSSFAVRRTVYALAGGAAVLVGIVVGRITLAPAGQEAPATAAVARSAESEPRITNVRFLRSDPASREVEFTFDAVTPVRLKGTIDDPRIQRVLAHAMLNEENPGTRLRAVSAIAEPGSGVADPEIKAALIQTLNHDENAGVRREALKVLQRMPFDSEIRNAIIETLIHDKNPALRIAAINCLDSTRAASPGNQDLLIVLREKATKDDNSYIRLKAREVLQEVKNQ